VHEQLGTRGEPGRAGRCRPPGRRQGCRQATQTPRSRLAVTAYPRLPRLSEPVGPAPYGASQRAPKGTLTGSHRAGFAPWRRGGGETPPPVPRDAGREVGDMWGNPPVMGDTPPRSSRGRVATIHVTPPLGDSVGQSP